MRRAIVLTILFFALALPSYAIKIGLLTDAKSAYIGASSPATIIDTYTNKTLYTLEKMKGYDFKPIGNHISIKINGKYYTFPSDNIVIKPEADNFLCVKNTWYRGYFRVLNRNGKLTVINDVDIENYIQGVVPAEKPKNWELEAYKAQAVAARSYAMANLGKRASRGYDLTDKPADQAYKGASCETPATQKAVSETKGIVIVHDNKIVPAFYFSSAGGRTKSAKEVWNQDLAYIKSVPSYDEGMKQKGHGVGMSQNGANNLAKNGYSVFQILQHFYSNIQFGKLKAEYLD